MYLTCFILKNIKFETYFKMPLHFKVSFKLNVLKFKV